MNNDHYNSMIEAANRRIDRLERLIKPRVDSPTHPIYDSTNFPQDAVPGQHVQDQNNDLWIFGNDSQWHRIGAPSLPWGWCRGQISSLASGSSLRQVDFNTTTGDGVISGTSGDPDITFQVFGTGRWGLSRNSEGTYLVATYANFSVTSGTPAAGSVGFLNSQWLPGRPLVGGVLGPFLQIPGSTTWSAFASSLDFLDIDGVNISAPTQGDTAIAQNSGQSASVFISQFAVKISDVFVVGNL